MNVSKIKLEEMARDLNLNLLRVLVLLEKHRNLKRVGQLLGKTESAVSRYLTALREQFDEPLFIRSKQGLEPTYYTKLILPEIKLGLAHIENSVISTTFEPENYREEIKIAVHALALERYGEGIYAALKKTFPQATFALLTWSQQTCQQLLREEINLGLHIFEQERPQMIYQQKLLDDDIVLIADADAHANRPTWQQVIEWPFVLIRSEGWNDYRQRGLELLKQHGVSMNVEVVVDNIALGMELVKKHQFVSAIPRSCVTSDYHIIELPKELRFNANLVVCLKATERANPLHKTLVSLFTDVISSACPCV